MTLITGLVNLTFVEVLVTVPTCGVYRLKVPLFVTPITRDGEVSAAQRKSAAAVVIEWDLPCA